MRRHSQDLNHSTTAQPGRTRRAAGTLAGAGILSLCAALTLGLAAPGSAMAATPTGLPPAGKPPLTQPVPAPQGGSGGGVASAGQVPSDDPTAAQAADAAGGTGTSDSGDRPFETAPEPSGSGTTPVPASDPGKATESTPDVPSDEPTSPTGVATIVTHDDVYGVASGHSIRIDWADLVGNDVNPSGRAILPAGHTWPGHGAASVFSTLDTSEQYITYTADAGFTGTDSFQYEVRDTQGDVGTDPGTVIVHVYPQTSPVAVNDSYSVPSYHSIEVSGKGLTMNDTDADHDPLTVKLLPAYAPTHGTVTLKPGSLGGFVYTPTPGYVGTDGFGYQAVDGFGGSSALGWVTITVIDEIHANGSPVITGTPTVSSWLTVTLPSYSPSTVKVSYQWYRGTTPIPGATLASYSLHEEDAGSSLSVRVLASNPGMQSALWASLPTPVIVHSFTAKPTPTIVGGLKVGSKLTAKTGTWQPTPQAFTYQWMRNGSPIAGATAATRILNVYDQGTKISVAVTAVKPGYQTATMVSASTAIVQAGTLAATPVPVLSGNPKVGSKLTAAAGVWTPATVTLAYVWKRSGTVITGATGSSYTPTSADVGKTITVTVTGSKSGYTTVSKTSAASAKVVAKKP